MKSANYIAYRRTQRNLTQDALADQIGVDRNTIARIERGESKGYAETWEKIARGLNVSEHELRYGPSEENGKNTDSPIQTGKDAGMKRDSVFRELVRLEMLLDENDLRAVLDFVEFRIDKMSKKNAPHTA